MLRITLQSGTEKKWTNHSILSAVDADNGDPNSNNIIFSF